jgi:hypothetical protein
MKQNHIEYAKKLHLAALLPRAFYLHRKKIAWDVLQILSVEKKLDMTQIKTYFLFLSVYFNESNQVNKRKKFYSINGVYPLICALSKSYKKNKIFLSTNRTELLKNLNALKKTGLIAKKSFKRELEIYPTLFSNVKYSKKTKKKTLNKKTIQPIGEYANFWSIHYLGDDPDNKWILKPNEPKCFPLELTRPEEPRNIFPVTLCAVKDILEDFFLNTNKSFESQVMTKHCDVFYKMIFKENISSHDMIDILQKYLWDESGLPTKNFLFTVSEKDIELHLKKLKKFNNKYIDIKPEALKNQEYDLDLSERLKEQINIWYNLEGKNEKNNKRKSAQ